jgi:hypothetical protein
MTDSKAFVQISFSIFGKSYSHEWWINYTPEDAFCGMDARISQWFQACYEEAYAGYKLKVAQENLRRARDERDPHRRRS